jgi:hypothetical protein
VCWGNNSFGESTPPAGRFVRLALANTHACGVRHDGTVDCWGDTSRTGPLLAQMPAVPFRDIYSSYATACGTTTSGALLCWGNLMR